ncbi:MAG: DUF2207 family protein [Candidatus Scatovivens sp.]
MIYFFLIIILLIAIIIFANRFWVKRRVKNENLLYGIITIVLIIVLIATIIKFIDYKNKANRLDFSEYTEVFEKEGKFYMFDKNGQIIEKQSTIGDMISDYFIKDVFNANTNIPEKEAIKNNIIVIVISAMLFVYWVTLLILFEKEEQYGYEELDDLKLLEKYNPMIAACISQNRNIMGRDVIAVILKLIENKKILLRIVPNEKSKKIKYKYMISENESSAYRLDTIEKFIYDWLFEGVRDFVRKKEEFDYIKISDEGIIEIDLIKRIRSFSEEEDTYSKLEELRNMAKDRLKYLGANNNSVPLLLKVFNNVLMFFVLMIVGNHILSNGLGIVINNFQILIIMFAAIALLLTLPIIYFLSLFTLKIIMVFFKSIEEMSEKHTGRNLISKSVSIITATVLLIGIVLILPIDTYLVYDVLIIGIAFLVIQTDDYMLKHNQKILLDYYNLKRIENKIQDYSLMKEKNIEYIKLWDTYYPYSVALGIPIEVNKESYINYNIDENLIINKYDIQGIYYVCKSYFEVMWDFEFDSKKSIFGIISDLKNEISK